MPPDLFSLSQGQFGVQEDELLKCLVCTMSVTRGEQIQRFHTQQQAEGKKHNESQMCWLERMTQSCLMGVPAHVQLLRNKNVCLCHFLLLLAQRQAYLLGLLLTAGIMNAGLSLFDPKETAEIKWKTKELSLLSPSNLD